MKIKKALVYFISFFSLAIMFSVCYFLSYRNALKKFNENAVERNKELILSLEQNGFLQIDKESATTDIAQNIGNEITNNNSNVISDNSNTNRSDTDSISNTNNMASGEISVPVDTIDETIILPSTKYILQTYDITTGNMSEEELKVPSYLVGLTRIQVIEYLHNYMKDLTFDEFKNGLTSFELLTFSEDKVTLRKTYNKDLVEYQFFLKSQNGKIVVYYGDQKTVYEYTEVAVDHLTQYEQLKLEEGIFVKDEEELYSILENYSS